jgi:hypothetical protein
MFVVMRIRCNFVSTNKGTELFKLQKINKMKAIIKTLQNDYTFLNFYNSKEVYSRKGFDTARKAKNYAKKYNIELTETLPDNIDINIF